MTQSGARPREKLCGLLVIKLEVQIPVCASPSGHRATEFDVCPAGFQICFGLIFPYCAPISLRWIRNIYSVPGVEACAFNLSV